MNTNTLLKNLEETGVFDKKMNEPAKQWVNKYKALTQHFQGNCLINPGEIYNGYGIFPSKDIAISAYLNDLKNHSRHYLCVKHLGAFPVKS